MKTQTKPLSEINAQAIRLLSQQLGLADTYRFVNQFTTGHGDYTAERNDLFRDLSLDDIVTAIEKKRVARKTVKPTRTKRPPGR